MSGMMVCVYHLLMWRATETALESQAGSEPSGKSVFRLLESYMFSLPQTSVPSWEAWRMCAASLQFVGGKSIDANGAS